MTTIPKLIRNVQALRAAAALLVVGRHIGMPAIGVEATFFPHERSLFGPILGGFGQIGVDIFFVISGFIMVTTTWNSLGAPGSGLTFFVKRLIRIFPPYWAALVPLALVPLLTSAPLLPWHSGSKTNLLADFLLFPQADPPTLGVSWTLTYELFFYLVFAAILALPAKRLAPALLVWAAATCACYAAFHGSRDVLLSFVGSVLPLEFIAGAAIGLAHVRGRMPFAWPAMAAATLASAIVWSACLRFGAGVGIGSQAGRTVAMLVPAALLVYAAVALETTKGHLAPRWLVSLGDASYSLYLWHATVFLALGYALAPLHPRGDLAHVACLSAMLAVTIACSLLIYRFFERPVTAALNRALRRRRTAFVPDAAAAKL